MSSEMEILYRSFQTYKNWKNLSPAEENSEMLKEVLQAEGNGTRWKHESTQRMKSTKKGNHMGKYMFFWGGWWEGGGGHTGLEALGEAQT